jgi:hypothetical protein
MEALNARAPSSVKRVGFFFSFIVLNITGFSLQDFKQKVRDLSHAWSEGAPTLQVNTPSLHPLKCNTCFPPPQLEELGSLSRAGGHRPQPVTAPRSAQRRTPAVPRSRGDQGCQRGHRLVPTPASSAPGKFEEMVVQAEERVCEGQQLETLHRSPATSRCASSF